MYACPHTDEAISYSLRQMTRAEEQRYQAHIALCPPCRLKLTEVAETLDLLPLAVSAVEPPPQLRAKLLDRIKTEPRQTAAPKKRRHLPAWGAAAAAAALIAGSYGMLRVARVPIPAVQQAASTKGP
jgi:predicted anti-sigma-YlaC factor YlaD